jgi:hypothetical protein
MEKIVIGAPYEISIEPSIDIGEFASEIRIKLEESTVAVELKPIKGEKDSYSFIVPEFMKELVGKKAIDYCICVYKENARFEVDDGKLQFIDEKDFKVKVKDNKKMRRIEGPDDRAEEKKDKENKKEKVEERVEPVVKDASTDLKKPEPENPEDVAERLIAKSREQFREPPPDPSKASDVQEQVNAPVPTPSISASQKRKEVQLGSILENIESQKARERKRADLNKNIQKAIKKK